VKSKSEDHIGYGTGYGKPPENTRFKKGQSGNPKGRPKGSRCFTTLLDRALNQRVVINEGGRRKSVSKLEAAFKQVANKAASGDPIALRLLLPLLQFLTPKADQHTPTEQLDEADQKVFKTMLNRLKLDEE
jgi:hypothetical protein